MIMQLLPLISGYSLTKFAYDLILSGKYLYANLLPNVIDNK